MVSDATLNRFFAFHVIAIPLVILGLVAAHLIALHEVGSNNPDGIEVKDHLGPDGHPLDAVPSHPYYTFHDLFGVSVFLLIFSAVMFFAPEMGGYFLEYNNFIPADSLKTPPHIAPTWYFTPFYSVLRATTADFMYVLMAAVAAYVVFLWLKSRLSFLTKIIVAVIGIVLDHRHAAAVLDAKFWGVVLFGSSVVIIAFLPWLDHSPVTFDPLPSDLAQVCVHACSAWPSSPSATSAPSRRARSAASSRRCAPCCTSAFSC